MRSRWKFPLIEGAIVDEKSGRWSQSAFFNELLPSDDQLPEVWHQAEPNDWVSDVEAWRRWCDYLQTGGAAENVLGLARMAASRRIEELKRGVNPLRQTIRQSLSRFVVPMLSPVDVRPHLANPNQWKPLRSACELANAWFKADEIPESVRTVLNTCREYRGATLLLGIFEHADDIENTGRPTQTDLMLILAMNGGLAAVAVEGKVDEEFGPKVEKWRSEALPEKDEKDKRLRIICEELGLKPDDVGQISYQLLHRSYAAIANARRYGAKHAMTLIHSFSRENPTFKGTDRFEDLQEFAEVLRAPLSARNAASGAIRLGGVSFRTAWVADKPVSTAL